MSQEILNIKFFSRSDITDICQVQVHGVPPDHLSADDEPQSCRREVPSWAQQWGSGEEGEGAGKQSRGADGRGRDQQLEEEMSGGDILSHDKTARGPNAVINYLDKIEMIKNCVIRIPSFSASS